MKIKKNKPYIIAEIGINHEGKFNLAKKLIINASKANVNAVKFQIFDPITLAGEGIKKTIHQNKKMKKNEKLFNMWNRMTFSLKQWIDLKKLAKKKSLDFICSVFDKNSLEKAKIIGVDGYKIASSDLTDFKLFHFLKKIDKPILLSTGMGSLSEIKAAVKKIDKKNLYILHCVSLYPCPLNRANLRRILSLKKNFKNTIGYSDHCIGIDSCISAISLGARIIEKHFTLNKKLKGCDHLLSADYEDLKKICEFAKESEGIIGDGNIEPSKEEKKMRKLFRKSIFANRDISINEKLTLENLDTRRPEKFLPSSKINSILKKKTKIRIFKNQGISKSSLK